MRNKKYTIPFDEVMTREEIDRFCDNIDECDKLKMSNKTFISLRKYLIRNNYNKKVEIDDTLGLNVVVFVWGG